MCMKKFDAEKIFFWQTDSVFNLAIFDNCTLSIMDESAYLMKSTLLSAFTGSFQHFADMLQT